jgi:hypothetical protein
MKLKQTKLKHNPFKIHLENRDKVWQEAMRLHPPAPKPTRGVVPEQVGQFPQPTKLYYYKTPEIKYKEDEIRDIFYEQHPFELHRPRQLVEEQVTWNSIYGTPKVPLSGESVVQYTMELSKKMNMDLAYQKALGEFYKARQKQEQQEIQKRKQLIAELEKDFDHEAENARMEKELLGLTWTQRFLELERMELQKGLEFKRSNSLQ